MTPTVASATLSSAEQCALVQSVYRFGEKKKKRNCMHASLKSFIFIFNRWNI